MQTKYTIRCLMAGTTLHRHIHVVRPHHAEVLLANTLIDREVQQDATKHRLVNWTDPVDKYQLKNCGLLS